MTSDLVPSAVRRVVLVVLDGLRSDAGQFFDLLHPAGHWRGASTFRAQAVSPSVTACAMTSFLTGASGNLEAQERGLVIMHWPDADNARHSRGWMLREYGAPAQAMDDATGVLLPMIDLDDPATLLVAMADHGGGGGTLKHHNSMHPLDLTISLLMAGGSVQPRDLGPSVTLPDVPATVLWALGIPRPESYAGRPLLQAFQALPLAA